jgi:subtilase family serine protease
MNSEQSQRAVRLTTRLRATILVLGTAVSVLLSAISIVAPTAQAATTPILATLPQVLTPDQLRAAQFRGQHSASAALRVEIVMNPNNADEMATLMNELYDPSSPLYHHWLATGEFDRLFGPTAAQRAALDRYLRSMGLNPVGSPSAFLLDYVGTTAAVERAFHTQINNYMLHGAAIYANATAPQIPYDLSGSIGGIIGLDSITHIHSYVQPRAGGVTAHAYGAAPGGTGLSPQQIRAIYDANRVYPHTNGNGITVGVFELSNWKLSDVQEYEHQFGLYDTPIHSLYVDGGPTDHKGALEVVLDIDLFLALAPGVRQMMVYNGPNTTQGYVDELATIARLNQVAVLSLSWGGCESDTPAAQLSGEKIYLKQLAMQGISVVTAAGDSGAFDCEYLYQTSPKNTPKYANAIEVDDPSNNPYVTAAGGTSFFQSFTPGSSTDISYPTGKEYAWNTINNCTASNFYYNGTNQGHCPFGAGGGGNSRDYIRPWYQYGPGTFSSGSQSGSYCHASVGVYCRALPDVSINADPVSGYGVYCTDPGDTKDCPSSTSTANGWQAVGGTSTAAPLWAAIITLGVKWHHHRLGWMNPQLYNMMRLPDGYTRYFHDIAHPLQITWDNKSYTVGTNGHFSVTPGYDMVTGIGTPDIYWDVVGF